MAPKWLGRLVRSHLRGFSVAPILVLASVCLLIAFTLAAVATFQLNTAQNVEAGEEAFSLCEGAIAQGISKLSNPNPASSPGMLSTYGRNNEILTYLPDPTQPDRYAVISFQGNTSIAAGVQAPYSGPIPTYGYSTNNWDGNETYGWGNQTIPIGSARLIAHASFNRVSRTVEAIVSVPKYPYVLSSDGNISMGAVTVRAEMSMSSLVSNTGNNTPNTTMAANVGSNASIIFSGAGLITGDVVDPSPNLVTLAGTVVDGEIKQAPVALPTMKITAYDNSAYGVGMPPPDASGNETLTRNAYVHAASTDITGSLALQNATLYVQGDLTVEQGITGTGAVLVNGNVVLKNGATLNARTDVALAATGDITMGGTGAFQGLVYSEGQFSTLDPITVAGAFIAVQNASEGISSNHGIQLAPGTTVVGVKSSLDLPTSVTTGLLGFTIPLGVAPTKANTNAEHFGRQVNQELLQVNSLPGNPVYTGVAATALLPVLLGGAPDLDTPETLPGYPGGQFIPLGQYVASYPPTALSPDNTVEMQVYWINMTPNGPVMLQTPVVAAWKGVTDGGRPDYQLRNSVPISRTNFDHLSPVSSAQLVAEARNQAQAYLTVLALLGVQTWSPNSPGPSMPNLNMNNFLADPSPVRVVAWRELP